MVLSFFFHMGFEFFLIFKTRFVFVFKGFCFFDGFGWFFAKCVFCKRVCFFLKVFFPQSFFQSGLFLFLQGFFSSKAIFSEGVDVFLMLFPIFFFSKKNFQNVFFVKVVSFSKFAKFFVLFESVFFGRSSFFEIVFQFCFFRRFLLSKIFFIVALFFKVFW